MEEVIWTSRAKRWRVVFDGRATRWQARIGSGWMNHGGVPAFVVDGFCSDVAKRFVWPLIQAKAVG
jgi:hypothetical protein